jgi:hypothetical protein
MSGWIRSASWDGLFMLSALWIAPLLLLTRIDDRIDVYLYVTVAFWIGHRLSSSYLAYCTRAYRPLLTKQRTRFVWLPLGIAVGTFAFLFAPLPLDWPRGERVVFLAIIDYALVTYHFASQHYGVLSLYRMRAGARDAKAKRIDRAFALGVGGVLVVVAEAIAGTMFFQSEWLGALPYVEELRVGATIVVVLVTIGVLVLDQPRGGAGVKQSSVPRALYVVNVSALVLCALWLSPAVFIVLWTTQHWTAAVGLATITAGRKPLLVLAGLVSLSVVLYPLMQVEAAGDAGRWSEMASSPVASVLVAVAFVTAFVHYQLDRAVFRFSDPDVRRAAKALADDPA